MRRALLALLLLASPVSAATYYVSPTGSAAWASATSSSTPASMTTANANVAAGDVVIQTGTGVFSVAPSPAANGTSGSRITFIGPLAAPCSVSTALAINKNYVVVKGFAFAGGFSMSADYDSLVSCRFTSATGIAYITPSTGGVVYGNTFNLRQFAIECNEVSQHCPAHTVGYVIRNNSGSFAYTPTPAYEGPFFAKGLFDSEIDHNVFSLSIASGAANDSHFRMLYRCNNNYWHDNYWLMRNDAPTNVRYARQCRDSTMFQRFVRDTLVQDFAGSGNVRNLWNSSGNWPGTTSYNTFDSCLVHLYGVGYASADNAVGTKMRGNVIISTNDNAVVCAHNADSLDFRHNTVIANGTDIVRGAFNLFNNGTRVGWNFQSNIFYSRRTQTGTTAVRFEERTISGGTWDYNLYWSGAGGVEPRSDHAIFRDVARSVAGHFSATGYEQHSRFGSPSFADSSFAWTRGSSVNAFRPTSGTNAAFGPDGFVGAVDPNSATPPADTEPPAQINDLSGAALGTGRIGLSWTAAGDDNRAGVATNTYIKRYSAPISSEVDWTAATLVATVAVGSNSTGGEQQTYDVNSGLSAGTTYYFSVRSADEVPNLGALGNTVGITTSASPDTMVPYPVQDLRAGLGSGNSVTLSWTATGGDGILGQAYRYRIKYRVGATFVTADSAAATAVTNPPFPAKPANFAESVTLSGGLFASGNTYAFAMWVWDDAGNKSSISNVATVTIPAAVGSPSLVAVNNRRRRGR